MDYTLFEANPGVSVALLPDVPRFTIVAVSNDFVRTSGINRPDAVGKGLFELFPESPLDPDFTGEQNLSASFRHVMLHKEPHELPLQRYDIPNNDGSFSEKYWRAYNVPVLNPEGELLYIIHTSEDVTALVKAEQREVKIKGIEEAYNLFMQAPAVIGIVRGKDHVLELANAEAFKLWGRGPEIVGKPLLESIPELKGQGIIELFDQVFNTGEAYVGKAVPVTSFAAGKEERHYFDMVYQPYYEEGNDRPAGVFTISHDVTQMVEAQKKVEESEERLHTALEAAHMGTWDYNPVTSATIASEGLKRLFGLSPEQEFTYELFIDNVIEEDRAHMQQVNQDVIQFKNNKSDYDLQFRIKRINDGALRWIRAKGKVHVNEEGTPYRFTGTLWDITREKKAEERYQNIFETVPVSIWEKDYSNMVRALQSLKQRYGQELKSYLQENKAEVYRLMSLVKINDTNLASLKMFEAENKEQLLKSLAVVFTDETLPAFIDELMAIAGKEKSFQGEYVLQTLKGRKIQCLTTITLPQNNDYGSLLVSRYDISDLKKAEKALKESEERFRTMANSIPQLAWMTDEKGWIYWYNERWYDYTGTTPEEMLSWGWRKVHHPDLVEGVVRRFTAAIEAGSPWEDIFLLRSKEGEYRWFLSRSVPVRKEDGTLVGWFGTNTDITEQHKIEEALKKSQEQLLLAMEGGELGYYDYYVQTGEFIWSARMRELFGVPPDATVDYNTYLNALHPEDRERAHTAVQKALLPESSGWYENVYRVIGFSGDRLRWLRSNGKVFFDEQGKAYRLAGVVLDITKQKEAEEALKQSKERLKLVIGAAKLGLWDYNISTHTIIASERSKELFNWEEGALFSIERLLDAIHPNDRQRIGERIQNVLSNPDSPLDYYEEYRTKGKTGATKWLRSIGKVLLNEKGERYRFLGVHLDITEEKLAAQAIQESEERFRTLAETLAQLVWMTNAEGKTQYASSRWTEYAGMQPVDTASWQQVVHPDDWPLLLDTWKQSLQNAASFVGEARLKGKTGEYRWFAVHGEPVHNSKGEIVKWIGAYTDINDQKTFAEVLEKLVEERTKELHQSNEDLQQFVHVSAHDLKEPVRKIKTFVSRLEAELNDRLDETGRTYLSRIQTSANRLLSMIDGVHSYSTISALEEIYEPVDLNEVIKHVELDLELAIQQKGAAIHSAHLPKVEGAPVMLHQVFYNLISNSLKFARADVAPVVTITSETIDQKGKDFVRIILQDNGIGFEQKYAGKIFGTFTRLHPKDKYEGAGLGLTICKKIVERHGGSIVAKGAEDKGTVFEILLPIKK